MEWLRREVEFRFLIMFCKGLNVGVEIQLGNNYGVGDWMEWMSFVSLDLWTSSW